MSTARIFPRLAILFLLVSLSFQTIHAQTGLTFEEEDLFNIGLDFYRYSEFQKAAAVFVRLDTPEAHLFAGKSYFNLGEHQKASEHLTRARSGSTPDVHFDASYTLALNFFRMKRFGEALDLLYNIKNDSPWPDLAEQASLDFDAINRFIMPEQRVAAVLGSRIQPVREIILTYAIQNLDRMAGQRLIGEVQEAGIRDAWVTGLRSHLNSHFADVVFVPELPDGYVFNIGVLLPQQDRTEDVYQVSRELYYGLLMAAEDFNRGTDRARVAVHVAHHEPGTSIGDMFTKLKQDHYADVIFGPLYSNDAKVLAELSAIHSVPVVAPLANSDDLSGKSRYFFQSNPNFSIRGRKMADIAVNTLGYDTLAIIVDVNSNGLIEARAFRQRAEELGAEVAYFFSADFWARRFEVSDFTQYFAGSHRLLEDTTITLRHVDALFLPFTGEAGTTLIERTLTDLLALRSRVSIIGTEEWGLANVTPEAMNRFNIVYSAVFNRDNTAEDVTGFRADYENRFGHEPDMFAFAGYDNGRFIMQALLEAANPLRLPEVMRSKPLFEGLGQHIFFDGGQVNTAIQPLLMTRPRPIRIK